MTNPIGGFMMGLVIGGGTTYLLGVRHHWRMRWILPVAVVLSVSVTTAWPLLV